MRTLLGLIVVLAVLLVGADRVGVAVAQDRIADRVQQQYKLPRKPGVHIDGVPFLDQAVRGRYDKITVTVGDWTQADVGGDRKAATVHGLAVDLSGVAADTVKLLRNKTDGVTAATATASTLVPYDTVKEFAPDGVEDV